MILPWLLATSLLALQPGEAAVAADPPPASAAARPSSHDQRIEIGLGGRTFSLEARILRPGGAGPFPLVVINHGTPPDKSKLPAARLQFGRAANWFADRGYMVVLALRPGFGGSTGPYLEAAGACADENYVEAGHRTAAIEAAIVRTAQALPGADPGRVIVVGQSAGGFGAVALGGSPPAGVLGVISFAGGRGGNGREHICAGEGALVDAEREFGRDNRVPQLWLYAANDHFFRPELAHRMAETFSAASKPHLEFVDLPPFGEDGHRTFAQADPQVWAAPVSAFLAGLPPR